MSSSQLQHTTRLNLFFWLCNVSPEVQLRCQLLRTYLWFVVCFLLEEILFRPGSELSCQAFNKIWEKWRHYLCFGFMHWLPVCFKIDFKSLLLTPKAIHGQSPNYLSELLVAYEPKVEPEWLWGVCELFQRHSWKSRGDRTFPVKSSKLWHELPEEIMPAKTMTCFKFLLKTFTGVPS